MIAHLRTATLGLFAVGAACGAIACGGNDATAGPDHSHSIYTDAAAPPDAVPHDAAAHDTGPHDGPLDVNPNGDGRSDGTSQCTPGKTQGCWPGQESTKGIGACKDGTQTCSGSGEFGAWGDCKGAVTPTKEECGNGVDDDCDGKTDCQDSDCPPCTVTFYSGSTWTAPKGVTVAWLTGTGGGGGGGGFGTGSTAGYAGGCMYPQGGVCYQGGGGGGGGAASVAKYQVSVTEGTTYTIVIGQGGAQSQPYQIGVAGGATSFGALLTLGGGGGADNEYSGTPGPAGGDGGQPGVHGGDLGGKGGDTLFGLGGDAGKPGTGYGSGGGGVTWSEAGLAGSGAPGFLTIEW